MGDPGVGAVQVDLKAMPSHESSQGHSQLQTKRPALVLMTELSTQRGMDRVEQLGPGERFFEQSNAPLQHLSLRNQFTGVA